MVDDEREGKRRENAIQKVQLIATSQKPIANRISIPLPFDCSVEGPVCRPICYSESQQWADAGLIHDACPGDMGGHLRQGCARVSIDVSKGANQDRYRPTTGPSWSVQQQGTFQWVQAKQMDL